MGTEQDMTYAFLDRVTSFAADHITPAAADWSMGGSPDAAIYEMAGQIGILGMPGTQAIPKVEVDQEQTSSDNAFDEPSGTAWVGGYAAVAVTRRKVRSQDALA